MAERKGGQKYYRRQLARIRRERPDLSLKSRDELMPLITNNGSTGFKDPTLNKNWCVVAYKICKDAQNPYRELDACPKCPSYIRSMAEFYEEVGLTPSK